MKLLFKSLLLIVIFFYALIAFMPKENIYYLLQEKLSHRRIDIVTKTIDDKYLKFFLKENTIYYMKIKAVNIKNIDTKVFLYDNTIIIKNISIDKSFKHIVPSSIKNIIIRYKITNPLKITIKAKMDSANLVGYIDIVKRKLILNLKTSKTFVRKYKNIINKMKKTPKGYSFEYKF